MAGPLETVAVEFIKNLDALAVDGLISVLADDVEGVEEISRQWLRGRDAVEGYLRELVTQVSDIHTEMRDVNERSWGDVGVLTSWLDQTYLYEGNEVRISAPTTLLFRRVGADWKMALFHSVPLSEQD
jgi:SnoaL-like domain